MLNREVAEMAMAMAMVQAGQSKAAAVSKTALTLAAGSVREAETQPTAGRQPTAEPRQAAEQWALVEVTPSHPATAAVPRLFPQAGLSPSTWTEPSVSTS